MEREPNWSERGGGGVGGWGVHQKVQRLVPNGSSVSIQEKKIHEKLRGRRSCFLQQTGEQKRRMRTEEAAHIHISPARLPP